MLCIEAVEAVVLVTSNQYGKGGGWQGRRVGGREREGVDFSIAVS